MHPPLLFTSCILSLSDNGARSWPLNIAGREIAKTGPRAPSVTALVLSIGVAQQEGVLSMLKKMQAYLESALAKIRTWQLELSKRTDQLHAQLGFQRPYFNLKKTLWKWINATRGTLYSPFKALAYLRQCRRGFEQGTREDMAYCPLTSSNHRDWPMCEDFPLGQRSQEMYRWKAFRKNLVELIENPTILLQLRFFLGTSNVQEEDVPRVFWQQPNSNLIPLQASRDIFVFFSQEKLSLPSRGRSPGRRKNSKKPFQPSP
ncbi:hypothetical protein VNO77_34099 [Canavalia gladiata]|uniref:Uncharacterized protein n=1 Tax=Canavalia gladiata TaxID=3824 RepID=A0AAN9KFK5_CANGL